MHASINTCQTGVGQPQMGKRKDMVKRLCGAAMKCSDSGAGPSGPGETGWLHVLLGPGVLHKGFRQP